MSRTRQRVVLASMGILLATTAVAHHSFNATYQLDQQVTLEGKITRVLYRNPHSILELDARGADGATEHWTIEMGAALPLSKSGIEKDTLKAGDEVTVNLSPLRAAGVRRSEGVLRTLRRPADNFEWGFKPEQVAHEWASGKGPCTLCAK